MHSGEASAGSPSSAAADDAQQQFKSQYAEFLDPAFEVAEYAQRVVREDRAASAGATEDGNSAARGGRTQQQADQIARLMAALSTRAESLDDLVRKTVVESHEDLLNQVIGVKMLDSSLGQVEEQVREIKSYMHGLRTKIRVPYEQSQLYTNQSSNLQVAIQHVRAMSKFIQLVRRLRMQMPDSAVLAVNSKEQGTGDAPPDYALAALTLLDIDKLVHSSDLKGIRLVDDTMERIVLQRRELTIGVAESMIDSGMRRQHQGDIAGGLQVLFNLGVLASSVAKRVRGCTVDWAGYVSGKLDPKAIHAHVREHNAKATTVDGSDMVGIDSVLWSRLESIVDELLSRGLELRVLERVLARKRDVLPRFEVSVGALESLRIDTGATAAGPGVSFLDLVAGELGDRALAFWWGTAVNALAAEIDAACVGSGVIRQILTNSYPRLVQLFLPRLEHILSPRLGGVVSIGGAAGWQSAGEGVSALPQTPGGLQSAPRQSANVSYSDPGPRTLWELLLGRFESEYVAKAALRIEEAVGRCYPPPPPPGLLDAQESWGHQAAQGGERSAISSRRDRVAGGATDMERMTAVNIVPNRKLVSGVVRSVSTELEMAKSDSRLCGAVAVAAAKAVASFVDITRSKIASITVNPSVLDPLGWPAHPLTKSYVGLVNAVDALRRGIAEVGGGEDAAGDGQTPWATKRRMSVMARRRPRESSARSSWAGSFAAVAPPASGSPGTPGFADDAGSRAASAQQAIGSCLLDLAAFVDEHVDVLLGTADRAITGAIVDGTGTGATSRAASAEDEASTPGRADVEQAMQWLQTQVLELLETDFLLQVGTMVDGYMRLYVRAVCLTFPLTEAEKLRLTAEVTQFEFASSQLVGSAGSPARRREKLTLDGLGSSFQSLRLMRPLLFTRSAELANILDSSSAGSVAEAGGIDAGGNWRQIPLLDMLDHTVCRLATEACAPDEGFDRALQYLPNGILGCTRRQWMACVSACDGLDIAWESTVDICKNPAMRDVWRGGVDMRASCRAVLRESLSRLSGRIQRGADEGIGMLAKAAEHALAADSG